MLDNDYIVEIAKKHAEDWEYSPYAGLREQSPQWLVDMNLSYADHNYFLTALYMQKMYAIFGNNKGQMIINHDNV